MFLCISTATGHKTRCLNRVGIWIVKSNGTQKVFYSGEKTRYKKAGRKKMPKLYCAEYAGDSYLVLSQEGETLIQIKRRVWDLLVGKEFATSELQLNEMERLEGQESIWHLYLE